MLIQLSGWLSLIGVICCSSLYFWNIFNPSQDEVRVKTHCSIGLVSLVPIIAHILSMPLLDFNNWMIWSGVGLYFIIISSGVVLLYLPDAGSLRYHARSIHPALLVGLAVVMFYHVLQFFRIL